MRKTSNNDFMTKFVVLEAMRQKNQILRLSRRNDSKQCTISCENRVHEVVKLFLKILSATDVI